MDTPFEFLSQFEYDDGGDPIVYDNHDISTSQWVRDLSLQRLRDINCDLIIISSDSTRYRVHSVLIASLSKVLRVTIRHASRDGNYRTINMSAYDSKCIADFVEYAYSGIITVSAVNVVAMYEFAYYHELDGIIRQCYTIFVRSISIYTVRPLYHLYTMVSCHIVYYELLNYCKRNILRMMRHPLYLVDFPYESVRQLIRHRSVRMENAENLRHHQYLEVYHLFIAYLCYIAYDIDNRLRYMDDIDELTDLRISCVHPIDRNRILRTESFSALQATLSTVFKRYPFVNNLYEYTSNLYQDVVVHVLLRNGFDQRLPLISIFNTKHMSNLLRRVSAVDNIYRPIRNYIYVSKVTVYYDKSNILCAIDVAYRSRVSRSFGKPCNARSKYVVSLIGIDERIVDIKMVSTGSLIYHMTFHTSYGNVFATGKRLTDSERLTIVQNTTTEEYKSYLYAIHCDYVPNQRNIHFDFIYFVWIH